MTVADLSGLRSVIGDCHRCPLGDTRTTLVFGDGNPAARIMLVGEAPGRTEDLGGRPFIGAAGRLLDELLAAAGVERSEVYIANVLKCRPPKNRDPKPSEVEVCRPFLDEQIRIIDPGVVLTLGNFATRAVLGTTDPISAIRGVPRVVEGRTVLPVFHPAAAIYDRSKRDVLFADFGLLTELMAGDAR